MSEEEHSELYSDIVRIASENLAQDLLVLDVSKTSDFVDYFVIASGLTPQHLDNLAERIVRSLRKERSLNPRREGSGNGGWVILDYGGLMVHLMTTEQREHYDLEGLWSASKIVLQHE